MKVKELKKYNEEKEVLICSEKCWCTDIQKVDYDKMADAVVIIEVRPK